MLHGEAMRRRGERSSPLQASFDFATSLFGPGSARVSRIGDRGLFCKDCFGQTPKPTRETRALPGYRKGRSITQQRIVIARRKPLATP
jgi:hypothetical protein